MKTRSIVPAILSVVILSTPVFAAGNHGASMPSTQPTQKTTAMTLAEKCTSLEKQFDAVIKTDEKTGKAIDAKTMWDAKSMSAEGGNLCAAGKRAEGIAKLEQALEELGVKEKS